MYTTVKLSNKICHIFWSFFYFLVGSSQWKYGFLSEIFSVCILVLLLIIIPEIYYDKSFDEDFEPEYNIVNSEEKANLNSENNENNLSINNNNLRKEKYSIKKGIICNLPYILISLFKSNRLFIFVAIDFWYSDYL